MISSLSEQELKTKISGYDTISLDTETAGDFNDLYDRKIVMLQLGTDKEQFVWDTRKSSPEHFLRWLSSRNTVIVGHNLKYDYQVIKTNYNVEIENLWDTMLAAQIAECGKDSPKGHFSLEQCVSRYVRPYYTSQGDLFAPTITKKIRSSFSE